MRDIESVSKEMVSELTKPKRLKDRTGKVYEITPRGIRMLGVQIHNGEIIPYMKMRKKERRRFNQEARSVAK